MVVQPFHDEVIMTTKKLGSVLVAAATVVALAAPFPADAIVGGAPDDDEHPYVGQLIFYVPSAVDPRFDTPGGWFNCTGTLIDPDTVVTAGHCTFDVGVDGRDTGGDGLSGGNDIWFSTAEAPIYTGLPPSASFVPSGNQARYDAWSAFFDDNDNGWHETSAVFTHPQYIDSQFLVHDLGVFTLSEPIYLDRYGVLPTEDYLDRYAGQAKHTALFESVGYGLEDSGPKMSAGGDTRRKADRQLVSFRGVYGLRDIAVKFSHNQGRGGGGTCFGDSGGPTFDITGSPDGTGNLIVAVTSFGLNYNCNTSGSYRIDQPDDLAFINAHD